MAVQGHQGRWFCRALIVIENTYITPIFWRSIVISMLSHTFLTRRLTGWQSPIFPIPFRHALSFNALDWGPFEFPDKLYGSRVLHRAVSGDLVILACVVFDRAAVRDSPINIQTSGPPGSDDTIQGHLHSKLCWRPVKTEGSQLNLSCSTKQEIHKWTNWKEKRHKFDNFHPALISQNGT